MWLIAGRAECAPARARLPRGRIPCGRAAFRVVSLTSGMFDARGDPLPAPAGGYGWPFVPLKSGEISTCISHIMLSAMARKIIVARALERAEQRVLDGERLIAQQNELIADLSAAGLDASAFHDTLVHLSKLKVYALNQRLS